MLSYAPYLVAQEEGFFSEQGLNVELLQFQRSQDAIPALVQGQLDVLGGALSFGFLNAITRGGNIRMVADKGLRIELMLRLPADPARLNGCGLLVINAPHTLADDLGGILPEIARRLSDDGGAHYYIGPILGAGSPARRRDTPYRRKRLTA